MNDIVFDAKTGEPIGGSNVIPFPRRGAFAKPIPVDYAEAMTIKPAIPISPDVNDRVAQEELAALSGRVVDADDI